MFLNAMPHAHRATLATAPDRPDRTPGAAWVGGRHLRRGRHPPGRAPRAARPPSPSRRPGTWTKSCSSAWLASASSYCF